MKLGLETESYHLYFQHGKMDIFSFITKVKSLGLDGVQINIIPDLNLHKRFGTLKSNDKSYLKEIKDHLKQNNLYVQIDSRWLEYDLLKQDLEITKALGANILRTYLKVDKIFNPLKDIDIAVKKILKIVPLLKEYDIKLALENHEWESSENLLEIISKVSCEFVGVLFDVGNSMMVRQDPLDSLKHLLPHIFSVHFKDHIVTLSHKNEPVISGVPIGLGSIQIEEIYKKLALKTNLDCINIETCYPYSSTIKDYESQSFRLKHGSMKQSDFTKDGFKFEGVFKIKPNPIKDICPMQYYYPHKVSQKHLESLMQAQEQCVRHSVEVMKSLRRKYESYKK